jgi:4-amino-4-deoxy-L-arabinose transferase-like glycosyltransferase
MDAPGTVNVGRRRLALLLFAGLVLFFWRLGSHDLWPPDEPRFALVAKEMWARGDYSVLSLDDHLYTDKPPLFFWAINGFGRLLGRIDEWAARLPSAVSTVLALLLIERLGAWLYDRRTGLLAALVFGTSLQILERGRWASIDMTLNLFVLSAIVLLWLGRARRDWCCPSWRSCRGRSSSGTSASCGASSRPPASSSTSWSPCPGSGCSRGGWESSTRSGS